MSKTFNVGEKVRATKDCMGVEKGRVYEVKIDKHGDKIIGNGCECKETWLPAVKNWDTLEVGDEVVDKDGDKSTVLDVRERLIFLSRWNDKNTSGSNYTREELIKAGYTIVQDTPEEEILELTIDQIAEKFGRDVKDIKIKK